MLAYLLALWQISNPTSSTNLTIKNVAPKILVVSMIPVENGWLVTGSSLQGADNGIVTCNITGQVPGTVKVYSEGKPTLTITLECPKNE